MTRSNHRAYTIVELLVLVVVIAGCIALILPAIQKMRQAKITSQLSGRSSNAYGKDQKFLNQNTDDAELASVPLPKARVQSFNANIELTPKLSNGTATQHAIYETRFQGTILAVRPGGESESLCEFELPLPPQTISVADVSIESPETPNSTNAFQNGKLLWRGTLTEQPVTLKIAYTAVGKGLFQLSAPQEGILDQLNVEIQAKSSDLRFMELSLQPTSKQSREGTTTYSWEYQKLLFGQPIVMDVLGIAPVDRLGGLTWLAPISVIAFGLLVGLIMFAYRVEAFDRWMLLLTTGTFAGAFPLMYYAQDYIPLEQALALCTSIALVIISIRMLSQTGLRMTHLGVILPAVVIMGLTLTAAMIPSLQGILLTAGGIGVFVSLMMISPRLQSRFMEWMHDSGPLDLPIQSPPLPLQIQRPVRDEQGSPR